MAGTDEKIDASLPDEDGAEGGESASAPARKFDARKILLFGVAPLVLLIAIGGGLFFSGVLDGVLGKKPVAEDGAHGTEEDDILAAKKSLGPGIFMPMPDIMVNLSSPEGEQRHLLHLSVQLELKAAADVASVEAVMPRVVDQFQTYLRELRVRDLRGSAGIYRLQVELLARVNAATYPVEVKDVLFQRILIQ